MQALTSHTRLTIRKVVTVTWNQQCILSRPTVSFRRFSSITSNKPRSSELERRHIVLVDSELRWNQAIEELAKSAVIGFDTESMPEMVIYKRHSKDFLYRSSPHLIQLSTENKAYLFSTIDNFGNENISKRLGPILESKDILKVGFDLCSDILLLNKNHSICVSNIVDLAYELTNYRHLVVSIVNAVKVYLNRKDFSKSKRTTISNWALPLKRYSPKMIHYAANDAFLALKVYLAYQEGGRVKLPIPHHEIAHQKFLQEQQMRISRKKGEKVMGISKTEHASNLTSS